MSQEIDLAWSRQIRINHVSPLSDNHPPCSYSLQLGKFRFQIRPGDICPMISRFRNFFVFVKFENLSEILRNIYIRIACIGIQLLAVFFFVFADTHRSWQLALNQLVVFFVTQLVKSSLKCLHFKLDLTSQVTNIIQQPLI